MSIMKIFPASLLAFFICAHSVADEKDVSSFQCQSTEQINYQNIFRHLDDVIRGVIEKERLPVSRTFGRDQSSAQKDIDKAIENVINLLESPRMNQLRANYRRLEQRISREKLSNTLENVNGRYVT